MHDSPAEGQAQSTAQCSCHGCHGGTHMRPIPRQQRSYLKAVYRRYLSLVVLEFVKQRELMLLQKKGREENLNVARVQRTHLSLA
jgi:hypothetical protein